jgi:hypothetical protein
MLSRRCGNLRPRNEGFHADDGRRNVIGLTELSAGARYWAPFARNRGPCAKLDWAQMSRVRAT